MQYRLCDDCGAHLDPGERCDGNEIEKAASRQRERPTTKESISSLAVQATEVKLVEGRGVNA